MIKILLLGLCLLTVLPGQDRPLLLIVDQSFSMNENDPRRFAVDSVQLAIAILRQDKSFSVIGFSTNAQDLVPWGVIGDNKIRAKLRDEIDRKLDFPGRGTRYVQALRRAYAQLETRQAPMGTKTIFFTDGAPDEDAEDIAEMAQQFSSRGWIIDTMLLKTGAIRDTPELTSISRITRGRSIVVTNAETLVDRFVELAASENDYFTLDAVALREVANVVVPPGARSLVYLVAKNEDRTQRGSIAALTCDGADALLGADSYAYPGPRTATTANIEVRQINQPRPGSYESRFDGVPRKVYVSLGLDLSISTLAVPAEANEGVVITPGIRILAGDARQAEFLASKTNVTMIISDAAGTPIHRARISAGEAAGLDVRFPLPWPIRLPDGVDRSKRQPLSIAYQVAIDRWRIDKHDAFTVVPARTALPPSLDALWPGDRQLFATWVGTQVEGALEVTLSGVAGKLEVQGELGFTFPGQLTAPGPGRLAIRYAPETPGRHRPRLAWLGLPAGTPAPALPSIEGHGYPWQGKDRLDMIEPGQTGIPSWSPGHADPPPQVFAGATAELRDATGASATLVVDAQGQATLQTRPQQAASAFTGTLSLPFGSLPRRQVAVNWRFTPARPTATWGALRLPAAGAWKTAQWAETAQTVRVGGASGRLSVKFDDLVGPQGERILAAYDIRAAFKPERVPDGQEAQLEIRLFKGRDLLPGVYTGDYVVTFTPDSGTAESWTRRYTVEIP